MVEIARCRPDWSVILMGPVLSGMPADGLEDLKVFRALPNGFYIPGRPAHELPGYYDVVDVGLMAYRLQNWAPYIFPLKFFEFLAVGKPVVSSPLGSLDPYANFVRYAVGVEEWLVAIGDALQDSAPERIEERRRLARLNSWEQRARTVFDLIQDRLGS